MTPPDRIPPHNLEAERAVLGIVLLEGAGVLPKISEKLQAPDFYTEAHRTIYSTMLAMGAAGEPIDIITLTEELRRRGELEQAGGPTAIALLEEQAAISPNLPAYLAIVRQMAIRRELIQASASLLTGAYDAVDDVQLLVDRSHETFERIASRAALAERPFRALTLAELRKLEIPEPPFFVDKWIPMDKVSFVVGDSEAFKSWFTLYVGFCIAAGVPLFDRIPIRQAPVLVISEENGLDEDKRRVDALCRGMGFADELPLHIASDTSFSFDDAAQYSAMRAYVDEHKIRLVIIDSFVRVHRRKEADSGEMNALYIDRIKPLLRAGVAIVALHHKRKAPSGIQHAPPSDNDDIRGSGDIRASAHAVLFLRPVSEAKVVVKHNKARGWKKQEAYVFGLQDADKGGVALTYEGKPQQVLDKAEGCRLAVLEYAQQHGTFFRTDVITALKGKFSQKAIDATLKKLGEEGIALKVDELLSGRTRKKFYTYTSADPDPGSDDDEAGDVPF